MDVKYYDEEYPAVDRFEASALADKIDVQTCIYVRGKDDSLCCKTNPDGGIVKAYLKIDCPGQWNGREAISFNEDGFIGFCGWADSQNSQPFYRAWREWCCRYLMYKYDYGQIASLADGLDGLENV